MLLDALHEDVNRVMDKPHVPEPDDQDPSEIPYNTMAEEAWQRYLRRNRSVIVDLFQGQIKSERRCVECGRQSAKFEPFMYLTVAIPAQDEKTLSVLVVFRPPLPSFDTAAVLSRDVSGSNGGGVEEGSDSNGQGEQDEATSSSQNGTQGRKQSQTAVKIFSKI